MATKIIRENPMVLGAPRIYHDKLNKYSIKEALYNQFIITMQSMTEYENLPDTMPKHLYERYLLEYGWCCITQVKGELYAFMGGLGGELDAYYLPTICVVSNPYLNFTKELKIGEECIISMNDSKMQGVGVYYDFLCQMLTENLITMNMYDINKRMPNILQANDSSTEESARLFLKKIYDGDFSVIMGTTLFDSIKTLPFDSVQKMDFHSLIEYHQYILSLCYNYCGLDATFNMKKSTLNTAEVTVNHGALHAWTDNMMEFREKSVDKINKMYGTNIKVKLASGWSFDRMLENMQMVSANDRNIVSDEDNSKRLENEELDEETEKNNLLKKLRRE